MSNPSSREKVSVPIATDLLSVNGGNHPTASPLGFRLGGANGPLSQPVHISAAIATMRTSDLVLSQDLLHSPVCAREGPTSKSS
jgi:hypothetical protein